MAAAATAADSPPPLNNLLCPLAAPHPSGAAVKISSAASASRSLDGSDTDSAAALGSGGARKEVSTSEEDTIILTVDKAFFYQFSWFREILFWFLCLCTAFFLRLLLRWNDDWHARLRYARVPADSLNAHYVVVRSINRRHTLVEISVLDPTGERVAVPAGAARTAASGGNASDVRYLPRWRSAASAAGRRVLTLFPDSARRFEWRHEQFYYDPNRLQWSRIVYETRLPYGELQVRAARSVWEVFQDASLDALRSGAQTASALSSKQAVSGSLVYRKRLDRENTYGANILDVQARPLPVLVLDELLGPFFIFQVFSIIVWFTQEYNVYAYTILAMSLTAVLQTAITTWFNMRSLQRLARTETAIERLVLETPVPLTLPPPPTGEISAGDSRLVCVPPPVMVSQTGVSSELLPGDLVVISAGLTVPCDLVLLTGSCVVNEAMLTGESAPVLKVAIPAQGQLTDSTDAGSRSGAVAGSGALGSSTVDRFSPGSDRDGKYMLFSGTRIVQARSSAQAPGASAPFLGGALGTNTTQTRPPPSSLWQLSRDAAVASLRVQLDEQAPWLTAEKKQALLLSYRSEWAVHRRMPVIAMVVQTSFATAKGQLVRAILYPKPSKFDFQRQSYKFIFILVLATLAGCLATVAFSIQQDAEPIEIFKSCLNLITVAIPPALPLALSIGLAAAQVRVQARKVFCTAPPKITSSGRVNCLCFDKTGTLTEEGLTLHGVKGVTPASKTDPSKVVSIDEGVDQSSRPLLSGSLEKHITPLFRQAAAQAKALSIYEHDWSTLSPEELAAGLNLGLVHVLAGCHSLSLLDNVESAPSNVASTSGALARRTGNTQADVAGKERSSSIAGDTHDVLETSTPLLVPTNKAVVESMPVEGATSADFAVSQDISLPQVDQALATAAELPDEWRSRFVGDPLEVQMFLSTGWSFAVRPDADEEAFLQSMTAASEETAALLATGSDAAAVDRSKASPKKAAGQTNRTASNVSDSSVGSSGSATLLGSESASPAAATAGGADAATSDASVGDILPPCDDPLAVAALWKWPGLSRHVDTVLLPSRTLLEGSPSGKTALAILRRFDFDSALRRMSVVVQHVPLDALRVSDTVNASTVIKHATVLCKGAPESMKEVCRPSTIPADFDHTLRQLAVSGFRVLACAIRPLRTDANQAKEGNPLATEAGWLRLPRSELEHDLLFVGFLVMENRLKATTSSHLDTYTRAGLRCIMVTGDNPLTAAAVATRCGPYFLRPARRPWLLDMVKRPSKPGSASSASLLSGLVIRDLEGYGAGIDFATFLQERLSNVVLGVDDERLVLSGKGPNDSASGVTASASATRSKEGRLVISASEMDLVVTGPAFFVLLAHHENLMASLKAAQAAQEAVVAARRGPLGRLWVRLRRALGLGTSANPLQHHQQTIQALEAGRSSGSLGGLGEPDLVTPLELVLHRAGIFARMSPQNKQELMTALQDLGLVVCMTGDGANDSGALKAADVGISIQAAPTVSAPEASSANLSVWERFNRWVAGGRLRLLKEGKAAKEAASQAVMAAAPSIAAPFSTQFADIGVVHIVLSEGRNCLVTSFSMFQYMFCFGVIQFTSVLVLYRILLELADLQYLWADLGMVFPLVVIMPLMRSLPQLSRGRPESDLLAPSVWRSVVGLSAIIISFQVGASAMLQNQPWYERETDEELTMFNWDTATSFLMANFQYGMIGISLAQSYGVFRERIVQNPLLLLLFIAQFIIISLFVLLMTPGMQEVFSLIPYGDPTFAWKLWGLGTACGITAIIFQRFMVPHLSPDAEPFDVDGVIAELSATGKPSKPSPKPDYQPTFFPPMRWRKPRYETVDVVSDRLWASLN